MTAPGAAAIPVTVVGGYLGAGKTTLVNACLRTRGERRIAILVNDFGDINIDAALIESQTDTVMNLAGGCVCCSIGSDFMEALFQIAALSEAPGARPFDHLLVETSGVALPRPLAQSITLTQQFRIASILVLADAPDIRERLADGYVGDTVRQQLQQADWVLLTKTDAPGAIDAAQMQALVPGKPVLALSRQAYDCDWLLGETALHPSTAHAGEGLLRPDGDGRLRPVAQRLLGAADSSGSARAADQAGASGESLFDSLAIEMDAPVDVAALREHLLQMACAEGGLVRAKGLLRDRQQPGQRLLLQLVGQRATLEP